MQPQRNSTGIDCFACGHRYDHLGTGPHPGVCRECGLRAVSLAGDVAVVDVQPNGALGQAELAVVVLEDATDRVLRFYLSVADEDRVARLYVARFEDTRVTPASPYWASRVAPPALRRFVASETGFGKDLHVANEPKRDVGR